MKRVKLFCLPYAGGSAMVYLGWKRLIHQDIEVIPIELAGRGSRIQEPLYHSMDEAVDDVYGRFGNNFEECNYAFYGHSMGTILVYELLRKIIRKGCHQPEHIFFSGRYPPYIRKNEELKYTLPDQEFIDTIYELGGTSPEFLENNELRKLYLPILRADYRIVELYRPGDDFFRVNCDITILHGRQDPDVTMEDVRRWEEFTHKGCRIYEFDDGHFFINKFRNEVTKIINDSLVITEC